MLSFHEMLKSSVNLFLTENKVLCHVIKMDTIAAVQFQKSETQKLNKLNLNTDEVTATIKRVAKRLCNGYAASYTNNDGDKTESDKNENEEKINKYR